MLFGQTVVPHFGPDSARKHESAGYPRITGAARALTADVDTREDLERAGTRSGATDCRLARSDGAYRLSIGRERGRLSRAE